MIECLVCGELLISLEGGMLRCVSCGYVYPGELFADIPAETMKRIRNEHLACEQCEQVLPGVPKVWANRKGEPIACPVHAKRLRWWQWRAKRSAPR